MNKIKTLIIDDEPKLRKVLSMKLMEYCKEVEVIGEAANVAEGFSEIITHNPDLIFLDISMPGGSGFDLIKKFEKINFEIIFVTGFNDYVLDAIRVSAVDYLVKPIITEDLIVAVEKANLRIQDKEALSKYKLLQYNLENVGDQESKIAIPGTSGYDIVVIKEILRCEGWQKYTKIHLEDQRVLTSSYNIGVFKKMLENYNFYTCHKSHLVNTKHISKYLKEGTLIMSDQSNIPVARRKREEFTSMILNNLILK